MLRGFLEEGYPLFCGKDARWVIPCIQRLLERELRRGSKVIFLADYLEPTRRFEELKQLRELAQQDLDSAYQRALETKIRYIQSRGRPLHPRSLRALASVGISLAGA
jgi:HD superfamily phosphohydrolase YqeK